MVPSTIKDEPGYVVHSTCPYRSGFLSFESPLNTNLYPQSAQQQQNSQIMDPPLTNRENSNHTTVCVGLSNLHSPEDELSDLRIARRR